VCRSDAVTSREPRAALCDFDLSHRQESSHGGETRRIIRSLLDSAGL
jgi:hypothetical protein